LQLTLIEGKLTRDTEALGKMDPFVEIKYLNNKYRTRVHDDGGKNPMWNETLEIPIESIKDELALSCLDQDAFSADLIGETTIPLKSLIGPQNPTDGSFTMIDRW
jgi:Ca2+-dependent lipid-binding protein